MTAKAIAFRRFAMLAKVAATAALLWFVISRVDLVQLVSRLSAAEIALAICSSALLLALQSLIAAFRLQICTGLLGHRVGLARAWGACLIGGFFSHTPFSFVGGDALRVWKLVNASVPLTNAAKAVLIDRALGFVGTMALVLVTSPALYELIRDPVMKGGYMLVLLLGIAGVCLFIALGFFKPVPHLSRTVRWLTEFATVSRHLSARPVQSAKAVTLALVINALNPLAVWTIAQAYGMPVDFYAALIASPVVFLIAMVPISVAGWGLREGAFVVALGLFGLPSAAALTISVTFGVAVLLAYLPGAALLFVEKRRTEPTRKPAEFDQAFSRRTGHS